MTERVSVASDGTEGNDLSEVPALSADGRFVAFDSVATNLVPNDTNGATSSLNGYDVFVRDRLIGTTERVSVTSLGGEGNGPSSLPSISPDGRYISFSSSATNLVENVAPIVIDAFVHDRLTGTTELVSRCKVGQAACSEFTPGKPGNHDSKFSTLTSDGRFVAFESLADNLISGDTNFATDIYVRDRGATVGIGNVTATCGNGSATATGWATFSGDIVASADDPPGDGAAGAATLGAELTGASIAYRPERDDLFVRLKLTSLPMIGTAPGILYGFQFTLAGVKYEVRATKVEMTATSEHSISICSRLSPSSSELNAEAVAPTAITPSYSRSTRRSRLPQPIVAERPLRLRPAAIRSS